MQALVYTMIILSVAHSAAEPNVTQPSGPWSQPVAGTTLSIDMVPVQESDPPIWVSRDEVSWDLYDALVYRLDTPEPSSEKKDGVTRPTKPYLMADRGWGHTGYPALSVSRRGAEAFCLWLSDKTGKRWRLPTVQEWTSLCEASGVTSATSEDHAWHAGNAEKKTHAIGSRKPDANGLNDLCGNVAEWCSAGDDNWVLMGGCYKDVVGSPCSMQKIPVPEWNDTDPQIPKSIWWLSDAPFAGFRVVCEGEVATQEKEEEEEEVVVEGNSNS